jgi:hypothetical protein
MTTEEKYQQIEDYLSGNLTGDALINFKARLEQDASFATEVELHSGVQTLIQDAETNELRNILSDVDSSWSAPVVDTATKKELPKKSNFKIISLAASAIAACFVLFFAYQYFSGNGTSQDGLYAANFEPYQMILTERGSSNEDLQMKMQNDAIKAYQSKNFKDAALIFNKLYTENESRIEYRFYRANAFLADGQTTKAIDEFKEILTIPNHLFTEQSQWYLSMAYLSIDDFKNAKINLEKIKDGQYMYKEASNILKQL